MLRGERDYRGRAAKRRGDGSAVEIIGTDDACRGALLDMAMAVDASRQYKPAARIDLPYRRTEVLAERRHRAVFDADITQSRIGGGRHGAAPDDQIILVHSGPSSPRGQSSATVERTQRRGKGT